MGTGTTPSTSSRSRPASPQRRCRRRRHPTRRSKATAPRRRRESRGARRARAGSKDDHRHTVRARTLVIVSPIAAQTGGSQISKGAVSVLDIPNTASPLPEPGPASRPSGSTTNQSRCPTRCRPGRSSSRSPTRARPPAPFVLVKMQPGTSLDEVAAYLDPLSVGGSVSLRATPGVIVGGVVGLEPATRCISIRSSRPVTTDTPASTAWRQTTTPTDSAGSSMLREPSGSAVNALARECSVASRPLSQACRSCSSVGSPNEDDEQCQRPGQIDKSRARGDAMGFTDRFVRRHSHWGGTTHAQTLPHLPEKAGA